MSQNRGSLYQVSLIFAYVPDPLSVFVSRSLASEAVERLCSQMVRGVVFQWGSYSLNYPYAGYANGIIGSGE